MMSIKGNLQYISLITLLAIPLLGLLFTLQEAGGLGVATVLVLNILVLPIVTEVLIYLYRRLRNRLYKTGNLKEVWLYCALIAPFISLLSGVAYLGCLLAMGLIGLFLRWDWKVLPSNQEGICCGQASSMGAEQNKMSPVDPNPRLFVLIGVFLVPGPLLWFSWKSIEFLIPFEISTQFPNSGRLDWITVPVVLSHTMLSPLIGRCLWLLYLLLRRRLESRGSLPEVLVVCFFTSVFFFLVFFLFFLIGIGGALAILAIGFFLWQDGKEIQATLAEPLSTVE